MVWNLLDSVKVSNDVIKLFKRNDDFLIKINDNGLMSSHNHNSEEELAKLACASIGNRNCSVLIGGLGMGFTLASTLRELDVNASITVAELIPIVVSWNRSIFNKFNNSPLDDKRVILYIGDVIDKLICDSYDVILLDVDNGPKNISISSNNWLYTDIGLNTIYKSLRQNGVLAVWSVDHDIEFTDRLSNAGFDVKIALSRSMNLDCVIWIAKR